MSTNLTTPTTSVAPVSPAAVLRRGPSGLTSTHSGCRDSGAVSKHTFLLTRDDSKALHRQTVPGIARWAQIASVGRFKVRDGTPSSLSCGENTLSVLSLVCGCNKSMQKTKVN